MQTDYGNWIPEWLEYAAFAGAVLALVLAMVFFSCGAVGWKAAGVVFAVFFICGAKWGIWLVKAHRAFSYTGESRISQRIVEGVAGYVILPGGGIGLDVGCGSGALTIACARRNPGARMIGCDLWQKKYAYSLPICRMNAEAEGVSNVDFQQGDARKLCFPDGFFDAVTSNYVFHNIVGAGKQVLLLETLRVLKRGGVFAIHDIMTPSGYGDMQDFVRKLKKAGFSEVRLVRTMQGEFLDAEQARSLKLEQSLLLTGRK